MLSHCNRAFKEWDLSCRLLAEGQQTLLIRKGGIREDGGEFLIEDKEFFLMPTFDHQNAAMLQPTFVQTLEHSLGAPRDHNVTVISAYAVVDTILKARDEEQVNALQSEMIWNESYVRLRFEYNPYDPVYLMILRVYRLPAPVTLPMVKAYGGCRSWITLERDLSTADAIPAIEAGLFESRKQALLEACNHV